MSVLSICNIMLVALEDEPIQDFTDTKAGQYCDSAFDAALASTLALRDWNCNATRAKLVALNNTDEFAQFAYQYQLPDNCLNVRAVVDPTTFAPLRAERHIEGRRMLTNIPPPLYIRYGRRLTRDDLDSGLSDVYPLPPHLEEAIAYKLGTMVGKSITGEQGDREYMEQKFIRAMQDAGAIDSKNEIRLMAPSYDDWVDVNGPGPNEYPGTWRAW